MDLGSIYQISVTGIYAYTLIPVAQQLGVYLIWAFDMVFRQSFTTFSNFLFRIFIAVFLIGMIYVSVGWMYFIWSNPQWSTAIVIIQSLFLFIFTGSPLLPKLSLPQIATTDKIIFLGAASLVSLPILILKNVPLIYVVIVTFIGLTIILLAQYVAKMYSWLQVYIRKVLRFLKYKPR